MADFFRVMGKAFALVFGSTLALALVLVFFVIAMRPVLRSWSPAREAPPGNTQPQIENPPFPLKAPPAPETGPWTKYAAHNCNAWDEKGRCVGWEAPGFKLILFLHDCDRDGCDVYNSSGELMGTIPRNEIIKSGWTPVDEGRKK
jgi:hypothetical protein